MLKMPAETTQTVPLFFTNNKGFRPASTHTFGAVYKLIVLLIILPFLAAGQRSDSTLIQFSGIFLDADSLIPVPHVSVQVKGDKRGTTTDYFGAFSFIARAGDTVVFTHIGYKPFQAVIPDTLKTRRYTLVQLFHRDTYMLPEAVIFPWPSKEEFKEAFLTMFIPDDDLERARKNLEREAIRDANDPYNNDGRINYMHLQQAYVEKIYYVGQPPPISVFNPFAWAQFFAAVKEGKLKDPRRKK